MVVLYDERCYLMNHNIALKSNFILECVHIIVGLRSYVQLII